MSIYAYSILLTVIEKQSVSRAAASMDLTSSAVSHAISKTESEVGFSIFNRSKNRLTLTPDGEQLLPYIQNAVSASVLLEQKAAQIRGLTEGSLRLGVINSVAVTWLPEILSLYQARYPNVRVQIVQGGYQKLISGVQESRLDTAFVSHSSVKKSETAFHFIPLHKDRLMCVSPITYNPLKENYVSVEEIRDMKLISNGEGDDIDVEMFLNRHNMKIESDFTIDNDESVIAMVKCGFGHSIMPELSLQNMKTSDVSIHPIFPIAYRELGLITLSPKYLAPSAQRLISVIQQYALDRGL